MPDADPQPPSVFRPGGVSYLRIPAPDPDSDLWVATFCDPAGNLLGVWQHGLRG